MKSKGLMPSQMCGAGHGHSRPPFFWPLPPLILITTLLPLLFLAALFVLSLFLAVTLLTVLALLTAAGGLYVALQARRKRKHSPHEPILL